jgi:hypothetical protein
MSLSRAAVEINGVWDEMQDASSDAHPSVFISYARPDIALVEQVAATLKLHGFRAWWDGHIEIGAEFEARIERAMAAAVAVLVIWSEASVKSDWVKWEANQAVKQGKLVPLAPDGFDLRDIRPPFNGLNTLPLGNDARLIDEVSRLVHRR